MNVTMTVVLIVVFALMLIMPYYSQKKKNKEYMDMLQGIKVGDLVKTAGGIIGKVNKITDKGEVKTFVLETGSKTQKSYLEMDVSMIYCVLNKTTKPAAEAQETTAETEAVEPAEEATKPENEIAAEPKTEELENETISEPKTEEPEKKTAKKATTKRTSTKTSTRTSAKTSKAKKNN